MQLVTKDSKKKVSKVVEEEKEEQVKPPGITRSYIHFSNHIIPKLKEEEKLPHVDCMKKAGSLWKELSEKEKQPFLELENKDVKR